MVSDNQSTPQDLFDEFNERYQFMLDVCADESNTKCPTWYGPGGLVEDALSVRWPTEAPLWMNPPYSRGNQIKFVRKAIETAERGGLVVGLLPADTSTQLFHRLIWKRYPVLFLPRRIRFNGAKSAAKFGSMIVEFNLRNISRLDP